jgi:hypothetical protein
MIREEVALYPYSPYRGAPPSPTALAERWHFDSILLTARLASVPNRVEARPLRRAMV